MPVETHSKEKNPIIVFIFSDIFSIFASRLLIMFQIYDDVEQE